LIFHDQNRVFGCPLRSPISDTEPRVFCDGNPMDVLYLLRVGCYFTPTLHGTENWRSWVDYFTLLVCPRIVQSTIYLQLGLQILCWRYTQMQHYEINLNPSQHSRINCYPNGPKFKVFFTLGFYDIIAIVAGCIQTILYCDFFYLYITKVLKGRPLQLPAWLCGQNLYGCSLFEL